MTQKGESLFCTKLVSVRLFSVLPYESTHDIFQPGGDVHEIDFVIKPIAGRCAYSVMVLFFGREYTVKLQGVEDTQIQMPEHRAEKALRVHNGAHESNIYLKRFCSLPAAIFVSSI